MVDSQVNLPKIGGAHPPLRRVTNTRLEDTIYRIGTIEMFAQNVYHTLECGHTFGPELRVGCRQPRLPQRRRCKECQKKEEKKPDG